ncbi:hypothetical protein FAVG1_08216 [Fusarium avenaceum]|nr:hypothetical protein FAVG1_08216 [Fusarium avenaceum]
MEIDPIVLLAFGPPPDGINLEDDTKVKFTVTVLTLLFISAVFLSVRIAVRAKQVYGLSLDDYAIIVSWVFVAATGAIVVVVGQAGAGKHVWALTIDQVVDVTKLSYVYGFFFTTAVFTTKVSILLFYRRIFICSGLQFRLVFWFCTILVVAYPITFLFTMGFACQPLSHFWTRMKGTSGTCIDVGQFYVILSIINLLTSVIVLLIPVPEVIKLQMSRGKKAAVFGILALGGLVCIASAVRINYLELFSKSEDLTWAMGPVAIWSSVEPSLGIVSACLSSFKSFLRLFSRGSSSGEKSFGYQTTPSRMRGHRLRFDDEIALRSQAVGGEGNVEQTFSEAHHV